MKKTTRALHVPYQRKDPYGALSMPVYHCAAYEFENADVMADSFCGRNDLPDYSRVWNPTVTHFENRVKALAGAHDVVAVNSGMAAISNTLFALTKAGANIVSSRHVFGNTYLLMTRTLARFGVEARLCDLTDVDEVARHIDGNTCCIFLEIMTNPQLEVADLRALAVLAHSHNIPLVADTTVIPFTEFSAKALGVDIEIVSSTKYISGGATCIGGLIIDYGTEYSRTYTEKARPEMLLNLGNYMTPHVAYMMTLGLETLDVRYSVQHRNTLELARRLKGIPGIASVNYVGLEDNPFHELSVSQFGPTAGCVLTIDLADEQACKRFINRLKLIFRATNLFDNKTLAIHPASTIFGPICEAERREMGILDTTVRISVGLEDVDDLVEDIRQALED